MKLLGDINPSSFEIQIGICGKILIINNKIAHKIHTIASSISNPCLCIFFITNRKVITLVIIKKYLNSIFISPF